MRAVADLRKETFSWRKTQEQDVDAVYRVLLTWRYLKNDWAIDLQAWHFINTTIVILCL